MKIWLRLGIVLSLVLIALPVFAQDIGSEAAVLGKGLFGYNGLIGSDVSTPMEYSYNPAVIPVAVKLYGQSYGEIDYGKYNFSDGPDIQSSWLYSAFTTGKDHAARIGIYTTTSSPAETRALGEGIKVSLSTETLELAYAAKVEPSVYTGVSFSLEQGDTEILVGDTQIASGKAQVGLNVRIGTFWQVNKQLSFGVVYTYDQFRAGIRFADETGAFSSGVSGIYIEKLGTFGATFSPKEGTYLAASYQGGSLNGPGLSEDINLTLYSLTQYLSRTTNVAVTYSDRGWTYSAQYRNKTWCTGVTLGKNVYRRAAEYIGTADSFYTWIGRSW